MTMSKKKTLARLLILAIVIAVIVFGGRYERGYYAVASEPLVAFVGLLLIWIGGKKK